MGKYFCLNLHDIHTSHNLGLKLGYPTPLCPTFAKLYFRCYVSKSPIGNQKSAISMEGNPIWTMSKSGIELRSHIKEYDLIKQGQNRDSVKSYKKYQKCRDQNRFVHRPHIYILALHHSVTSTQTIARDKNGQCLHYQSASVPIINHPTDNQ